MSGNMFMGISGKQPEKRTSRDWRALRRALFTVSLIISLLLGANTAFLGWMQHRSQWKSNDIAYHDFTNQINASLSMLEYGIVTALAGAYLKREEVSGIVIKDSFDFEVVHIGISPEKVQKNNDYTVHRSRARDSDVQFIIVMRKPDYSKLIWGALLQAIITFLFSFIVLMLLLGDIVQSYFASPLMKLADAMMRTRKTGVHGEVKLPPDTQIGRLASIFNDMQRESTRRNKELKKALRDADSANVAKSAFLANMSHELRSPLNAIIGFSQMLLIRNQMPREKVEEKITEYAMSIEQGGTHLLQIVNTMLDLTRVENGTYKINPELLQVEVVLKGISNLIDSGECTNWLTIEHEDMGADGMVFGDYTVIRQVLINIITNAIRHNPPNTKVEVDVHTYLDRTVFTVTDHGVGMSEEGVKRALEPFARLGNPMVADAGGTGLGLPLSRSLILAHNGTFSVQSEEEVGTVICFTLPRAEKEEKNAAKSTGRGEGKGLRLLEPVEDLDDTRQNADAA